MNKCVLIILIFMGFSLFGWTQCELRCNVSNSNNDPIPYASVYCSELELGTFTTNNGEAVLNLPTNHFKITFSAVGFVPLDTVIDCSMSTIIWIQLESKILQEAVVQEESKKQIKELRSIEYLTIYEAKKAELVIPGDRPANLASNSARQVFAEVPGLNIWESDGAGLQLGIGGRGLNPNRTSNFNTRQNGYDISADPHGYPESYYTPPLQAIEKVTVLRGAASLQFGPQFGGTVNFRTRRPVSSGLGVISEQTISSWNGFNTFNAISQRFEKTSYHVYVQYKQGDGWRPNSGYEALNAFAMLRHEFNEKLSLSVEYTRSQYLAKQPGGLTDTQFLIDPTISLRDRNWFRVRWSLYAATLDFKINNRNTLQIVPFALDAERQALGFLGLTSRTDPLVERNLIRGTFENWGVEARYKHRFEWKGLPQNIVAGIRYFDGSNRSRQGLADASDQPSFSYIAEDIQEDSDYQFDNLNGALFVEWLWKVTEKLSITPGLRAEHLETGSRGSYNQIVRDGAGNILPTYPRNVQESEQVNRSFLLYGIGIERKLNKGASVYANYSENYRGINFSDIRIANPKQLVADDIQDEKGFNTDIGFKINRNHWGIEVSGFHLSYENRIGNTLETIEVNPILGEELFQVRKNLGDADIFGLESIAKADILQLLRPDSAKKWKLDAFINYAFIRAEYASGAERAIEGNQVEFVPTHNLKTGVTIGYKSWSLTHQFSYVSEQFTDATNAPFRSDPDGILGAIPNYWVHDINVRFAKNRWSVQAGVNNLLNQYYFTRRATGYPGPGIIPSEPRNLYLTLGYKVWNQ